MTNVADESMLRSVVRLGICGRIHAQETRCQSGVRSCILPGLSTHLVQELNAGTVHVSRLNSNTKMVQELEHDE